jgi:ketosteroid isomerase-like protein
MSQENVEAFGRAVEAMNRGDVEALLPELDPEVEWRMAIQELVGGVAGVYRGHDGVREYFRDMDEAFAEAVLDYPDVRDLGDRVLATGNFRTRGRHSGLVAESPVAALVYAGADGKATKVLTFLDPQKALEAAGLEG